MHALYRHVYSLFCNGIQDMQPPAIGINACEGTKFEELLGKCCRTVRIMYFLVQRLSYMHTEKTC